MSEKKPSAWAMGRAPGLCECDPCRRVTTGTNCFRRTKIAHALDAARDAGLEEAAGVVDGCVVLPKHAQDRHYNHLVREFAVRIRALKGGDR